MDGNRHPIANNSSRRQAAGPAVSIFSEIPEDRWIASNNLAFAVADGFPVSPGHSLIIPKRVVPTWFDASEDEQQALMSLLTAVKDIIIRQSSMAPDGWNIGINAGQAAGQTVPHLHVHLIPRWHGDVHDPRGGVRHVIPGKGNYLSNQSTVDPDLCTGHPDDPFLHRLLRELPGARHVDILAAFVQPGGVELIEPALLKALQEGASVRILAGDYLNISSPVALRRLLGLGQIVHGGTGTCETRVVELGLQSGQPASFHPKSWLIDRPDRTVVWVGSSNLSQPALLTGIEWNLRAVSTERPEACIAVQQSFNKLWNDASVIDPAWISSYQSRRSETFQPVGSTEHPAPAESDYNEPAWEPRPWQAETLDRLTTLRNDGCRRALAIVATGMGKTVLAALDAQSFLNGTAGIGRVLVIAHRAELLAQAAATIRRVLQWPMEHESWCAGGSADLSGRLVLASIQKLSRPNILNLLDDNHFDYVIIDEVHHAEAPTWRRVLSNIDANFMLGLTATPERADGKDVATIFDDVIACDIGIADGIREESLVPFAYYGITDDTDYQNIPWRNGRFDDHELEEALIHSPRMERLLTALHEQPGVRTLVFCVGKRHARFTSNWLNAHGITSVAVFSGEGSDDRGKAISDLKAGRIAAICAVDLFNEGVDIPSVDRVLMLRPTGSNIVFTQQLGRGLRSAENKPRLTVIDFVGNHRAFIHRMHNLLSLFGVNDSRAGLRSLLSGNPPPIPPGCLVDIDMEAKDLLQKLLPNGGHAVVDGYRAFREELGRRPTPTELFHRHLLPATLRKRFKHWFRFVESEGDLTDEEADALTHADDWLGLIETTDKNKSYKLVALRVLIDTGSLFLPSGLKKHATKARDYMLGHPDLRHDLASTKAIPNHQSCAIDQWAAWWLEWPISRLKNVVRHEDGQLLPAFDPPQHLHKTLIKMAGEIVEWRLADYIDKKRSRALTSGSFEGKVSQSKGRPILFIPEKSNRPNQVHGPIKARLPDGSQWEFRLVKIACNTARPIGEDANQLPDLLRKWFGPDAGAPGTNTRLSFAFDGSEWTVKPTGGNAPSRQARVATVIGYPTGMMATTPPSAELSNWIPVIDVAAAATAFSEDQSSIHRDPIGWLPNPQTRPASDCFIIQVRGQSMEPTIPDESWCIFKPPTSGSRQGRIVLVSRHGLTDPETGGSYTVKRYNSEKVAAEDGWQHSKITLTPDNPDFNPIELDPIVAQDMNIIGEFVSIIAPDHNSDQ